LKEYNLYSRKNVNNAIGNRPPILGRLHMNPFVVHIPANNINNTYAIRENYQVPKYFLKEIRYPKFMSGAGYILPWWTLPCIYQQSLVLPYYFVEDVFLTGWIGKKWLLVKPGHVSCVMLWQD
jgi:hypothetical protein